MDNKQALISLTQEAITQLEEDYKRVKTDHGRTVMMDEIITHYDKLEEMIHGGLSEKELKEIEYEAEEETYSTDTLYRLINEVKRLRKFDKQ